MLCGPAWGSGKEDRLEIGLSRLCSRLWSVSGRFSLEYSAYHSWREKVRRANLKTGTVRCGKFKPLGFLPVSPPRTFLCWGHSLSETFDLGRLGTNAVRPEWGGRVSKQSFVWTAPDRRLCVYSRHPCPWLVGLLVESWGTTVPGRFVCTTLEWSELHLGPRPPQTRFRSPLNMDTE